LSSTQSVVDTIPLVNRIAGNGIEKVILGVGYRLLFFVATFFVFLFKVCQIGLNIKVAIGCFQA
jgi:hypothetical protein